VIARRQEGVDKLSEKLDLELDTHVLVNRVVRICRESTPPGAQIYLFGSFARNEMRTTSDIDIAVDAGRPLPLARLADIRERLESSRIPYRVDLIDLQRVSIEMKARVVEEGIAWNV